jgi:hypothetical protein
MFGEHGSVRPMADRKAKIILTGRDDPIGLLRGARRNAGLLQISWIGNLCIGRLGNQGGLSRQRRKRHG